jgi:hypothetical protein
MVCYAMLLYLIGVCACSREIDPSKLPGMYEAHPDNGLEIIELRPNGTYTQYFTAANAVKATTSNSWKFEPFNGEPKIALQGFTSHFPGSPKADVVLLGVQRNWGRIRLYRSYDLDQYYVKIESK